MRHQVENHSCRTIPRDTTSRPGGLCCNSSFAAEKYGAPSCLTLTTSAGLERNIMSRRPNTALILSPFFCQCHLPRFFSITPRQPHFIKFETPLKYLLSIENSLNYITCHFSCLRHKESISMKLVLVPQVSLQILIARGTEHALASEEKYTALNLQILHLH